MDRVIIVGIGGFIGSVLRYLVSDWMHSRLGGGFPWGTLFVNLMGCFVFGALAVVALEAHAIGPKTQLFLAVGVLGGFTTFSAFGYEVLALIQAGRLITAAISCSANVVLGILAVAGGATLVRRFVAG